MSHQFIGSAMAHVAPTFATPRRMAELAIDIAALGGRKGVELPELWKQLGVLGEANAPLRRALVAILYARRDLTLRSDRPAMKKEDGSSADGAAAAVAAVASGGAPAEHDPHVTVIACQNTRLRVLGFDDAEQAKAILGGEVKENPLMRP